MGEEVKTPDQIMPPFRNTLKRASFAGGQERFIESRVIAAPELFVIVHLAVLPFTEKPPTPINPQISTVGEGVLVGGTVAVLVAVTVGVEVRVGVKVWVGVRVGLAVAEADGVVLTKGVVVVAAIVPGGVGDVAEAVAVLVTAFVAVSCATTVSASEVATIGNSSVGRIVANSSGPPTSRIIACNVAAMAASTCSGDMPAPAAEATAVESAFTVASQ